MSGLGTCPKCSKTAMIRSGADRCTRCQRDDEEAARAADVASAPMAAVPLEIGAAEGEMYAHAAVALADDVATPRRRKKPYVMHMGRVIADQIDEDD